ncbi:MAG: MoaD/ThiS family protein, partial [Polynucleobacter victoriensis]
MKITFKLFATLSDYLPPERQGNILPIEVPEGTSIMDIVNKFQLPVKLVHLVLVNGIYIKAEERDTYHLKEDDVLAIW